MDKRKRSGQKGKGKGKPHGGNRSAGNNGRRTGAAGVANGKPAQTKAVPKGIDPVVELLGLLRINPSTDGIKSLVDYVAEERADYYNLGKAVRDIMKRTLTDEEEALVKKLGANA